MPNGSLRRRGRPQAFALGIAVLLSTSLTTPSGCGPARPTTGTTFGVVPPEGWKPVSASTYSVPGTPLSAWSGPEGSSLVVYRTLPVPRGTPEGLADELSNRMENMPGLTLVSKGTVTVAGVEAARVEVVAAGTGGALAPTGLGEPTPLEGGTLVPTRRLCLGFLGPAETLWLVWHYPDSARTIIAPQIEATLKTLRPKLSASTSYSS